LDDRLQKFALLAWRETARRRQAAQLLSRRAARALAQRGKGCLGRAWRVWAAAALQLRAAACRAAAAAAASDDAAAR
jgi:hypothetical protein